MQNISSLEELTNKNNMGKSKKILTYPPSKDDLVKKMERMIKDHWAELVHRHPKQKKTERYV